MLEERARICFVSINSDGPDVLNNAWWREYASGPGCLVQGVI
jgi:hypothetical protein